MEVKPSTINAVMTLLCIAPFVIALFYMIAIDRALRLIRRERKDRK